MSGKKGNNRRTRYNQYKKYYSNTSEAYHLDAFPQENQRRVIEKRRIFRKRGNKPTYKYVGETISGISIYTIVTIILIFTGCLGMAFTFATLMNKQSTLVALGQDLKKIQESNVVLEAEISKNYDPKEIEKLAISMGMSKPKSHQIIHIQVPKRSYVVQHETAGSSIAEHTIFSKLADFLTKR